MRPWYLDLLKYAAFCGVVVLVGCGGPPPPLDAALAVEEVVTGYHDGGVQDGQRRLLPTIAFRVSNKADTSVSSV